MNDYINKSEFFHFGILPGVCIHSPINDVFSKMYVPREKCENGHSDWLTEGCIMKIGHWQDSTPIYKEVHRCKICNDVRISDHIGVKDA